MNDALFADNVNWISGSFPGETDGMTAKIRYKAVEARCCISLNNGRLMVKFEKPQMSVTPGQSDRILSRRGSAGWWYYRRIRGALMLSLIEEKTARSQGYVNIAGIDEVGRGPLAGPVLAAAVIMPEIFKRREWVHRIHDSKLLTPLQRDDLYNHIKDTAIGFGIGIIDSQTIDFQGIAKATRLAMQQAVETCNPSPQYLLIDYIKLPEVNIPQKGVVDGDSICFSIACASIMAKVTRDRIMVEMDGFYPGYGFAEHKGYGTREHLECLQRLGPCTIHRSSFQPVREVM